MLCIQNKEISVFMNDITRHLSNRVGIERFHSQLHNILQHLLNYIEDFENTFHLVSFLTKLNKILYYKYNIYYLFLELFIALLGHVWFR